MQIFLAGATGVIGRRAVPLLVAAGHQVSAIGRAPDKRAALERLGAVPVDADLFAPDALRRAVAGHAVVINLATHLPSGFGMFLPGAWRENDRVRRIGAANLADAAIAAGAERFVQESFAPAYPDRGDEWIDERTPLKPVRYNRSVVDAERAAERFAQSGRIGVVLRFAAFYGPDAWQTLDMIRYVRRGWAPIPASPASFFSSVSHDDAAAAVVAALRVPAGAYNVVDDEPVRRREYFDTLAAALGVAPPTLPPAWAAHLFGSLGEMAARSLRISNRKLRAESDWRPADRSVREGWQRVVAALRNDATRRGPAPAVRNDQDVSIRF
ncbi:MAG TPA: NAD(P)H-binding protein [Burkholderiales bacterium]|nr:NAD(P)H-binding protein [Burkholderiales bacterium]